MNESLNQREQPLVVHKQVWKYISQYNGCVGRGREKGHSTDSVPFEKCYLVKKTTLLKIILSWRAHESFITKHYISIFRYAAKFAFIV